MPVSIMPSPFEPASLSGLGGRPIAIGAQRTEILVAPAGAAQDFKRQRAIECRDLIAPDLLASLLDRCRRGGFVADHVDQLGSREVEAPQRVGAALNIVLSRPSFLHWIEVVTGCHDLHRVEGRLVQNRANGLDALDWHNDTHDDAAGARKLGITINLSDAAYEGGSFELRMTGTQETLVRYRHDRAGTALIFDIASDLEHRVLPLASGGPRRVFTGWFVQAVPRSSS
ncbi:MULTISPECIES: 2OG-Fe(II) oxygenase [unclassified Sphingomonas]|uniref:2OG-Fe(II) oxygenase n=1 Tax=unclassified Sphingomonas TaxID=196159 RepID=UPI0009E970F8|nr:MULTISPECIES: 2OG-Fe(II) oxygenase [unclassified Sphingomonas]TCP65995.1 2-oxoglutarate-Fe(II)-dependent oxygenase superfamily protein [Sphingomonas sp. PP-CE-1G-424]